MLQSSDSALCVQTQQEGERGRLNLGPVPKWADPAWCQGSCGQGGGRTRRLRLCSRKLACTHPWAWGRGGLGGQSHLQTHGGLPAQAGGYVTWGKSLSIPAHGLCLPLSAKFACSLRPPASLQPSLLLLHPPCAWRWGPC